MRRPVLRKLTGVHTGAVAARLAVATAFAVPLCSVKEFLAFTSRTLMKRLPAGVQCVDYEGALGCLRCSFVVTNHSNAGTTLLSPSC